MRQGEHNNKQGEDTASRNKKTLGGEIFREFFYQYTYLYFRE